MTGVGHSGMTDDEGESGMTTRVGCDKVVGCDEEVGL